MLATADQRKRSLIFVACGLLVLEKKKRRRAAVVRLKMQRSSRSHSPLASPVLFAAPPHCAQFIASIETKSS
eukprot:scaffold1462_cov168-Ochromonas_danica.AAC.10